MSRKTSEIGIAGEEIACRFLKGKGYRILGRNILERFGEIDILARDQSGVLVFVEVKTAAGARREFAPEQHFNKAKAMKSKRIAMFYAARHDDQVDAKKGWRVDLVTVLITGDYLTEYIKDCVINHYENV